ncbi:hypothetical protein GGR50DRAFT_681040 [Xylaria sp. CBS 124048]|nr:hypothetical protein GGR50DRAFT_681040 [Xylaria sp. CBS 124048]
MDGTEIEAKPVQVAVPCVDIPEGKATSPGAETKEEPDNEPVDEGAEEPTTEGSEDKGDKKTEETESKDATAKDDGPSIYRPPQGMLRVTGRHQTKFAKSDPATLAETDDPVEIRKQVEFYFGDSNLPEDKFLWEQVGGGENKPVLVSLIANFSRMRRFKPYEAVVKALKGSNFLIVDGPEGEETIRRKNPIDTEKRNKREERSVYVKGFGNETSSTQFDIEAFFGQYGQFDSVRLRRAEPPQRAFKGSVFVEWSDKETADQFMALDPQPQWKGHPLHIMTKLEYIKQKSEAIRDGKIDASMSRQFNRGSHRGHRGQNRGNGRGGNADNWKKRREQDQQNGFADTRDNHRGRGRGRGRGNFRGRGGRGGRDYNGTRDQDTPVQPPSDGRPKIHVSKEGAKIMEEGKAKSAETNGKRSREDEPSAVEPPTKKVDIKETVKEST